MSLACFCRPLRFLGQFPRAVRLFPGFGLAPFGFLRPLPFPARFLALPFRFLLGLLRPLLLAPGLFLVPPGIPLILMLFIIINENIDHVRQYFHKVGQPVYARQGPAGAGVIEPVAGVELRKAARSRVEHTGVGCLARAAQAENNPPLEQAARHSGGHGVRSHNAHGPDYQTEVFVHCAT